MKTNRLTSWICILETFEKNITNLCIVKRIQNRDHKWKHYGKAIRIGTSRVMECGRDAIQEVSAKGHLPYHSRNVNKSTFWEFKLKLVQYLSLLFGGRRPGFKMKFMGRMGPKYASWNFYKTRQWQSNQIEAHNVMNEHCLHTLNHRAHITD